MRRGTRDCHVARVSTLFFRPATTEDDLLFGSRLSFTLVCLIFSFSTLHSALRALTDPIDCDQSSEVVRGVDSGFMEAPKQAGLEYYRLFAWYVPHCFNATLTAVFHELVF